MRVSLVMGSWKRPELLDLGLWSLTQHKINHELEIIICNDYLPDGTKEVCNKYKALNIKYVFTGQRNSLNNIKWRSAGFALNIGVKQAKGEILILTCPEIVHLNETINLIVEPLKNNKNIMSIGKAVFFDDTGNTIKYLQNIKSTVLSKELLTEIQQDTECKMAVQMPYLMGIIRQEYLDIRGYDEDFSGYAGEDCDFVDRLKVKGLKYFRTDAKIVHLYHGKRCDSRVHFDNPEWKKNWELYQSRKGIIIRNKNREWGEIE